MSSMPVQLEVERVVNLIKAFGWDLRSQEIKDVEIVLTVFKKKELPSAASVGGPA